MGKEAIAYTQGEIGKVTVVKDFLPPTTEIVMRQSEIAQEILPLIFNAVLSGNTLSYADVAEKLGRPRNNGRMVAQVCDLLDAAAALAGTPLLALITVTEASGKINKRAWATGDGSFHRDAIIARSEHHNFGKSDFQRIQTALRDLDGRSNLAAWDFVRKSLGTEEVWRRIAGVGDEQSDIQNSGDLDALNDLGSDEPKIIVHVAQAYVRDPNIRKAVISRAAGQCELCGELGFELSDGSHYLEAHHIIALADDGADRMTNVIALCPNHHREAHYGMQRDGLEEEMVLKLKQLRSREPHSRPLGELSRHSGGRKG